MWIELDALEASAKAAREAKARKAVEAAEAAKIPVEEPPVIVARKSSVTFAAEPPSVFAAPEAAQIADKIPDTAPLRDVDQGPIASLRSIRSCRSMRMPAINKNDSLVAIQSGTVSLEDMHHLENEVEVDIPIPEDMQKDV